MRIASFSTLVALLLALSTAMLPYARAGEAHFISKPIVTRDGTATKIAFSVSESTDVEVSVIGADGKVVRHLAAGVLGGKVAPPLPLTKELSQSLVWDGLNDQGKPTAGSSIRVRMGASAGSAVSHSLKSGDKKHVPSTVPTPDPKGMLKVVVIDPMYGDREAVWIEGDPETGLCYYRSSSYWASWKTLDIEKHSEAPLKPFDVAVGELHFGEDGAVYATSWGALARKYDRNWNAGTFSALKSSTILYPLRYPTPNSKDYPAAAKAFGDELGPRTQCVGLDGKFYQFLALPETGYARVRIWKADGSLEKEGVIPFARVRHVSNICVDRQGRLYVAVAGLPDTYVLGARETGLENSTGFRSTLLRLTLDRWIDKPSPETGLVPKDASAKASGLLIKTSESQWLGKKKGGPGAYAQAGWGSMKCVPAEAFFEKVDLAIPGMSWAPPPTECSCCTPVFDLDRFGRIFVPDPALKRVRILDGNGNEIYEAAESVCGVNVLWPFRVYSFEDGFVFWDGLNSTLVLVRTKWAAVETCPL